MGKHVDERMVSSWGQVLERSFWAAVDTGLGIVALEGVTPLEIPTSSTWQIIGFTVAVSFVKNVTRYRLGFLNPARDIDPTIR